MLQPSDHLGFKSQTFQYWVKFAKQSKKIIVFYGEDVLDLTQFSSKHTAGEKAIASYKLQDIKNILFRIYPHPKSILTLLQKYYCGKLITNKQTYKTQQYQRNKGICKDVSLILTKKQQMTPNNNITHKKKVKFNFSNENNNKNKHHLIMIANDGISQEGYEKQQHVQTWKQFKNQRKNQDLSEDNLSEYKHQLSIPQLYTNSSFINKVCPMRKSIG